MNIGAHEPELDQLTNRLQDAGWATHVSALRLLEWWEKLADEVADYTMTVDDFTNDLTGRDGLERVLDWASPGLASAMRPRVEAADAVYLANTVEDGGAALGRYFRVDSTSAWWWHRKPTSGPLGQYLSTRT